MEKGENVAFVRGRVRWWLNGAHVKKCLDGTSVKEPKTSLRKLYFWNKNSLSLFNMLVDLLSTSDV